VFLAQTFLTTCEAETAAIGRTLGAQLERGAIVLLFGDLGAGKTAFVRGLSEGLGIDPEEVSSPTFTLIQEYRGRSLLRHVDLYRLEPPEVLDLGLEELAGNDAVTAVEWADRWPGAPGDAITVRIQDEGLDNRRITIETPGDPKALDLEPAP
jgi:tRNA threonylcarbamoyladenosine biosynthesis protein TsaE